MSTLNPEELSTNARDKCGKPVVPENDASLIEAIAFGASALLLQSRHLGLASLFFQNPKFIYQN